MKLLWLKFKRWFHWYNSARRLVIIDGPGTIYFIAKPDPILVDEWTDIPYTEDGWTFNP